MSSWFAKLVNERDTPSNQSYGELSLNHLSRAQLHWLLALEGLDVPADRRAAVRALETYLKSTLDFEWILSPLPGDLVPPCEYPTVVKANEFELLLFGGSQQGIAETARGRFHNSSTVPADAVWQCQLQDGDWSIVPTYGLAPGPRSGHSAVMHENKMWVYGGWNDNQGEAFGDMHVLHLEPGKVSSWEEVHQTGFPMEPRAWHSVCVHNGKMLLYGDNGECAQSQADMTSVYAFEFATRSWRNIVCKGRQHPQPQFVLAITIFEESMFALCFTEPCSKARSQRGPVEAEHGPAEEQALESLADSSTHAADESFMEVYRLDLEAHRWSRVPATGELPGARYGCSASVTNEGTWVIHGGISKCQDFILSDTYAFDFRTSTWTQMHCLCTQSNIPRTGHVGVAIEDTLIFIGGNSCAPEPSSVTCAMASRQQRSALGDPNRRASTVLSHNLHLSPISSHMPAVYRGEGDITYCPLAEVLWRRPCEPSDHADHSLCNADVVRGLRDLAAGAAEDLGHEAACADVEVTTADGERFRSFRTLLSAAAPAFRALFSHQVQEKMTGTLHIDAPAVHVRLLLDYVHGSLRSVDSSVARPLFQLADKYGVHGLAQAALSVLVQDLTNANVPVLLELGDMHSCTALKDACVRYVQAERDRLQSIIGSAEFVDLMQSRPVMAQSFLIACMTAADST